MATSEPLVPTGQPQGQRQENRAAMLAADLPLAPPVGGPAAPSSNLAGPPPGSPPPAVPGNFDVFADRQPMGLEAPGVPVDPAQSVRQQALNSPNAVMREIAAILPEYLE